jgi:hypothetical protein
MPFGPAAATSQTERRGVGEASGETVPPPVRSRPRRPLGPASPRGRSSSRMEAPPPTCSHLESSGPLWSTVIWAAGVLRRCDQTPTSAHQRRQTATPVHPGHSPITNICLIVGSTPSVRDHVPDRLPPLRGPFAATVAAGSRRSQGRSRVPSPRQWQSMRAGRWANGYRVVLAYTCDG